MIINFYSEIRSKIPFGQKFVNKIISQAIKELKIKRNFEITILLVNDKKIKDLNNQFRKKNKVTDVLSFSQKEGGKIILPKQANDYLGDIIISYPQIKRQAQKFKHSAEKEFALISIHGLLHLLGYEDETKSGYLKMEKVLAKILEKIYV